MTDRNNGTKTVNPRDGRGRFGPGNPGRPPGARHRTTLAVEALLEGEAEKLARKAVDAALKGDIAALRLCLDRIAPARREVTSTFDLPAIETALDHPKAIGAILAAVAAGELTAAEAEGLTRILTAHGKAIEMSDIEQRLRAVEGRA
tara:strand:+ start:1447 stop:1887 length:441 start_codon:yes stop_codon:yes gene_type:complete